MNMHETGKQKLKEVLGEKADEIIDGFNSVSPDFANYIVEFAYGDLYAREGLSHKLRELAAVSCLIGQGNTGLPLKAHLKAMLNVGWSKEEIIELIIFLVGYKGFPSSVDAILHLKDIINEQDNEGN